MQEGSNRFERLLEIAEAASPGFESKWEEWLNELPDPETAPSERDLFEVEIPFAIRGRGEGLQRGDELAEDFSSIDAEDTSWYFTIHARQGGGNDECWCDEIEDDDDEHELGCLWQNNEELRAHPNHLFDEYDMFDSTYITHVFSVPASDSQVTKLRESIAKVNRQKSSVQDRESVLRGKVTPWAAMTDTVSEFLQMRRNLQSSLKAEQRRNELEIKLESIQAQNKALEALPSDFSFADVDSLNVVAESFGRYSSLDTLDRQLERFAETEAQLQVDARKLYDAETYLPADSPLREQLLAERGMSEYTATEKRGRRNVKVRKKYDRGSELGFKVRTAQDRLDQTRTGVRQALLNTVESNRKGNLERLNKLPESEVSIDDLTTKFINLGWKGSEKLELPVALQEALVRGE